MFLIMKYENRLQNLKFNNKLIKSLSKDFGISENTVKLLFSRDLTTKEQIADFLNCGINNFYNPFLLSGMTEAKNKIQMAIENKKKILVVGDYDTDGICATAILYKYFESIGVQVDYFLPNRFLDGYGLTMETVDKIVSEFNPEFIITVDCGISCYKEVEYIKSKGIEIIVTDHHEIPEITPDCVCVDPKLPSNYPFKELCGAGVALKLVQALAGLTEALKYTNIAALATVADIVTLKSENRAIVKHGLENQDSLPVGVKKLISNLKITNLTSSDIAFKLAPKLNTAGRMGDATVAYKLFIEKNPVEIINILTSLEEQNNQRIEAGNSIYEECMIILSNTCVSNLKSIVLHSPHWHSGVLGIVCAKLTEKFNKPVCLLTKVDNVYKGSFRSLPGIDIFKELTKCNDLLVKFGGHSGAAGLTIEEKNIEKFIETLNNNIAAEYSNDVFEVVKSYDFDFNKEDISCEFIKELSILEPFGYGNEKPVFKYTFNNIKPERLKNYPNFLKFKADKFEMISFSLNEYFDSLSTNCNKTVLLDVSVETFNKKEKLKAVIKSITLDKLNTNVKNEICLGYYAKQLNTPILSETNDVCRVHSNQLESLLKDGVGTLIISNSFDTYNYIANNYYHCITNFETYQVKELNGSNTLLYLAKNTKNFTLYKNIVFVDNILHDNYLKNISTQNIYVLENSSLSNVFTDLSVDRKIFGIYHNAIKSLATKNLSSYSEQEYFALLKKNNPNFKDYKFNQFIFVTMTLSELGIISITNELDNYSISINKDVNNPLANSTIYNFVKLNQSIHKGE